MEATLFAASELKPGEMRAAKAGQKNLVVFCNADGSFSALEDRCSHAEVKLSAGKFDGKEVTCPAHGARFDARSGAHRCMPAVRGVKAYPVRVVAGSLVVEVD